jgi:hypothetical protein
VDILRPVSSMGQSLGDSESQELVMALCFCGEAGFSWLRPGDVPRLSHRVVSHPSPSPLALSGPTLQTERKAVLGIPTCAVEDGDPKILGWVATFPSDFP